MSYDSINERIHPTEQRCIVTQRTLAEILYLSYLEVLWTGIERCDVPFKAFADQPPSLQKLWMQRADKAMQSIAKGEIG